jgi:hypothetical protein
MNSRLRHLKELGVVRPPPVVPLANYVGFTRVIATLSISRQLLFDLDGDISSAHTGKLRSYTTIEIASDAARVRALDPIAQAQSALGDLHQALRVDRLSGFSISHPNLMLCYVQQLAPLTR